MSSCVDLDATSDAHQLLFQLTFCLAFPSDMLFGILSNTYILTLHLILYALAFYLTYIQIVFV